MNTTVGILFSADPGSGSGCALAWPRNESLTHFDVPLYRFLAYEAQKIYDVFSKHVIPLNFIKEYIIRVIKSRRVRWTWYVVRKGDVRTVYSIFVGRPEGKRQLGTPRHGWTGNIKMDLREMGWEGID
jgi:hypothetical protein